MQMVAYGAQDFILTGNYQSSQNTQSSQSSQSYQSSQSSQSTQSSLSANPPPLKRRRYSTFRRYDTFNQIECPICLSGYTGRQLLVVLPCHHVYHSTCHSELIVRCPVCRAPFEGV